MGLLCSIQPPRLNFFYISWSFTLFFCFSLISDLRMPYSNYVPAFLICDLLLQLSIFPCGNSSWPFSDVFGMKIFLHFSHNNSQFQNEKLSRCVISKTNTAFLLIPVAEFGHWTTGRGIFQPKIKYIWRSSSFTVCVWLFSLGCNAFT
jgi:hypothetical protein